MTTPSIHPAGERIAGRYRIVSTLGRGGAGVTYLAESVALSNSGGAQVALKQLHLRSVESWKAIELFEREARVLSQLSHPRIPRYLESFAVDEDGWKTFYLAQSLAPGRSLAARAAGGERFGAVDVRRIADEVLSVLEHLHTLAPAVIHRDLKPSNLVRSEEGATYLVDFGSVRDVWRDATASTVAGTFGFMAPEQLSGQALPASDLYGLGVTLVALLTGRNPTDLPRKGLKLVVPKDLGLDADLAWWLDRMIEPTPEARFRSAREARLALRKGRPKARRAVPFVLGGVLLALLLGGGGFVWKTERDQRRIDDLRRSANTGGAERFAKLPGRPQLFVYESGLTLERELNAHFGIVSSLAITADGHRLVSASHDKTVKVWDFDRGEPLRTLTGHTNKIGGMVLSHDDKTIVSAADHTVRLWSLDDGKPIRTIDVPGAEFTKVALDAGDKTIAVAATDGVVRTFGFADGQPHATMALEGKRRVLALAFSPRGDELACGGDGGEIGVFHPATGTLAYRLVGHTATIDDVEYAHDGLSIASSADDHTVRLWVSETGVPMTTLAVDGEGWGVTSSPSGGWLFAGTDHGTIYGWTMPVAHLTWKFSSDQRATSALRVTPDNKRLISGHENTIKVWKLPEREEDVTEPSLPAALAAAKARAAAAPPLSPVRTAFNEAMKRLSAWSGQDSALDNAQTTLRKALVTHPDEPLLLAGLASVTASRGYLSGHDYEPSALDEADRILAPAEKAAPRLYEVVMERGRIERDRGDLAKARAAFLDAESIDPARVEADLELEGIAMREKDYESALTRARRVIAEASEPRFVSAAYSDLTAIYTGQHHYDAADRVYRAIIEAEPDNAWAKGNYAGFLVDRGNYAAALERANAARSQLAYGLLRTTFADIDVGYGVGYLWDKGQVDVARTWFEAALKENPKNAIAEYGLAACDRSQALEGHDTRLAARSRKELEKALELDKDLRVAKEALAKQEFVEAEAGS